MLAFTFADVETFYWGMPLSFWEYSGVALLIGLIALAAAFALRRREFWHHFVRDLGLACLIAVLVSFIYEKSTRSVAEHETIVGTINRAMSSFVQKNVWAEVEGEVLRRRVVRRNVDIRIRLLKGGAVPGNPNVTLPPDKVLLWMSYSYDLYGLTSGPSEISVQHQLGFERWDERLQVPRFERVEVRGPDDSDRREYKGASLAEVYDNNGSIKLDGDRIVRLPAPTDNKPVRITTERYEIVDMPGSYNLFVPELIANAPESKLPTVKITFEEVAPDVEVEVNTYYAAHKFTKPDPAKNVWVFDGIMLPGQGLAIVLRRPAVPHPPGSGSPTQ